MTALITRVGQQLYSNPTPAAIVTATASSSDEVQHTNPPTTELMTQASSYKWSTVRAFYGVDLRDIKMNGVL